MAPLKKALDTTSFNRPLILIEDTQWQRTPKEKGIAYPPPCAISQGSFQILQSNIYALAIQAGFEFTGHPAYHLFDDERFYGYRKTFWQPMLKAQYPIYIISPLFGVMWPGDRFGPYDLVMEDAFIIWRRGQLWRVILEYFERNQCDCVISYLPPLYDNIVHLEEIPWFTFKSRDLMKHMGILLEIARKSRLNRKSLQNSIVTTETQYSAI